MLHGRGRGRHYGHPGVSAAAAAFTRLCSSPPGVHLRGARPEEQLKIRAKRVGRIYRETQKSWRIKGMTLPRNGSVEANAALRHAGVKPGISVTFAVGITAYGPVAHRRSRLRTFGPGSARWMEGNAIIFRTEGDRSRSFLEWNTTRTHAKFEPCVVIKHLARLTPAIGASDATTITTAFCRRMIGLGVHWIPQEIKRGIWA